MLSKPHALPETDALFKIVTCFWILSPRFIEIVTFANPLPNKDLRNFAQNFKMKINMKRLKAIGLFLGLSCALLWPLQTSAQEGGLFGLGSKATEQNDNYGMMKGGYRGGEGVGLGGAESENPTPVGSGIIILMAAGAGYAMLKRKEDKQ